MTTQPTNNPVSSESPSDLKFNAGKIDEFVTSLSQQYIDRFGQAHYTIEGLRQLAQEAITAFGWITVDSFQDGATLTLPNQVLRDEDTGEYYRWDGVLPKEVPVGSTPEDAGGIGSGAWLSVGDAVLRQMLGTESGASMIGTNHRGTLLKDLDAIDRRPDGYGDSISGVLANGNDVEIGKDISSTDSIIPVSNQHIKGAGGTFTQTTRTNAGIRIEGVDTSDTKDYVTVSDFRTTGSALSTDVGNQAYAVLAYKVKYLRVNGILAQIYTGGVALGQAKSSIIRDVIAHDTTFHPTNGRDGRGGYGVITDNIKDSLIDGVILDAKGLDDGRHILYASTGGYGDTSGNHNFIARNLIGRYADKDDRNFWGVNVRKSENFIISGVAITGANGGVAFNAQNGGIGDFILSDVQLDIIKYQDGVGVYGISTPKDVTYLGARFLISNFNIKVRPKTGITPTDCIAISVDYQNGMVTNGVTNVPLQSTPILINDGGSNVTISNIHDNPLPGYAGVTAPFIAFTGSAVSNITVKNITTSRPMFSRLAVVTDLTVDFQRKARIATNGSGGTTKIDSNEITGTVALTATGMNVAFPSHVTQNAVENVQVAGTAGAYQVFITSIGAKVISLAFYTPSGTLINPQATSVAVNIILSS